MGGSEGEWNVRLQRDAVHEHCAIVKTQQLDFWIFKKEDILNFLDKSWKFLWYWWILRFTYQICVEFKVLYDN